jgi:hypothetical protein
MKLLDLGCFCCSGKFFGKSVSVLIQELHDSLLLGRLDDQAGMVIQRYPEINLRIIEATEVWLFIF